MNQILSRPNSNISASGNVAELLFDSSSSLLDYSFNYPYFHHSKEENEYILYAIVPAGSFDIDKIKKEVFMTASEAEDHLLDQIEVKPPQHLFKTVRSGQLLVGGLYFLILNILVFDVMTSFFRALART